MTGIISRGRVGPILPLGFCLWIAVAPHLAAGTQTNAPVLKPTVAVLNFDVQQGVTKPEAQILSDRFAIELDRTAKFTLINRQRMSEQLALQKFSRMDTCSASECAVEAGRILGASYMVYGSIGKVGGTFSLNTYMISVESGATLRSASTDISGGIEEMLTQGLAKNAAQLAEPSTGSGQSGAAGKLTCAVLTFDGRGGVSQDEIRLFSDRFAIELDRLRQYTLVSRSRTEEVLKEQKFSRSENCSASECAIEAGKLLGVRYMVYGSIGLIGSLYTINTYMVDVESGAIDKTATTDFRGDKESVLTQGMRQHALNLLGLQEQQGYLNIRVTPADAALTLNGRRIQAGRVPVAANEPLELVVQADGYLSYSQTYRVASGSTLDVEVRLTPRYSPQPPAPKMEEKTTPDAPLRRRPKVH